MDFCIGVDKLQDYEPKEKSVYNEAQYQIARLNDDWTKIKRLVISARFSEAKYDLDLIWVELYADVERRKDKNDFLEKNRKIQFEIANSKNNAALYHALIKRMCFLKVIQDKVGKGGKYQDENESDFE